jgi:hypothetical protein
MMGEVVGSGGLGLDTIQNHVTLGANTYQQLMTTSSGGQAPRVARCWQDEG